MSNYLNNFPDASDKECLSANKCVKKLLKPCFSDRKVFHANKERAIKHMY